MNIPINIGKSEFRIRSDDLQYTVYETKIYGRDAKHPGEQYDTVHGYYSNVESCLTAIIDATIRRSDAATLQALKDDVEGIKKFVYEQWKVK